MPDPKTPTTPASDPADDLTAMGGAGDDNNGGGNASGTPDADTGMTVGDVINKGDVQQNKARLFPGAEDGPAK